MAILKIRDAEGNVIDVPSLKGDKGDKGDAYVLTDEDKQEIAELVGGNFAAKEELSALEARIATLEGKV